MSRQVCVNMDLESLADNLCREDAKDLILAIDLSQGDTDFTLEVMGKLASSLIMDLSEKDGDLYTMIKMLSEAMDPE